MRYKKLIECSLDHEFFQSDSVFQAEPSPECLKRLKKFSLMFRETERGFFLLFPCRDYDNNIPARAFDEETSFDFHIFASDPSWTSYSDLPACRPGDGLFYFSNLDGVQKSVSAPDNSFEEYASAHNLIFSRPKSFELEGDALETALSLPPDELDLLNEKGDSFKDKIMFQADKIAIDLENRDAGHYTLKLGEQNIDYYLENGLSSRKPFGIVSFSVSDQVAEGCAIAAMNPGGGDIAVDSPGRNCLIRVKARKTFWRYRVIPKFGANNLEDLKIVNGCGELAGVGFSLAANNGEGPLFVSSQEISLREKGYPDISLCRSDDRVLIPNLPNARPGMSKPEGDKVYSDIFVYV